MQVEFIWYNYQLCVYYFHLRYLIQALRFSLGMRSALLRTRTRRLPALPPATTACSTSRHLQLPVIIIFGSSKSFGPTNPKIGHPMGHLTILDLKQLLVHMRVGLGPKIPKLTTKWARLKCLFLKNLLV